MQFCEATGLIGQIVDTALNIISFAGWFGVILIVLVENVLPFIPSEVILPAVGFATVNNAFGITGALGILLAILITTFATTLGAIILFTISRKIGVKNISKLPFIEENGLKKAEASFEKYGSFAVFICRIIPVVRVLVTIPAGLSGMSKRKFILFSTLGSLIWNSALVLIGASVGKAWCSIEPVFSHYSKLVLVIAFVLVILAFFVKKKLSANSVDESKKKLNSLRVGVVGGGQLARMLVPPATELNVDLSLMVEDINGSASSVWKRSFEGNPKNIDDLRRLVYGLDGKDVDKVDVLTFEHEHIPNSLLESLEKEGFKVAPKPSALIYAQNKLKMREVMAKLGVAQPWFCKVSSLLEIADLFKEKGPLVLKAVTGGYDGKGVFFVKSESDLAALVLDFKTSEFIAEGLINFKREVSQVVVRNSSGQIVSYPLVETVQENGVCKTVICKNETPSEIGLEIAQSLEVEGVLAVEMFETESGQLLVNELAMRPHNTAHWTIDGSKTSQFENHLRGCLNLPLGSTEVVSEVVVMENILGSSLDSLEEKLQDVLILDSRLKVNLYNKGIRQGRKLGHINILGKLSELDELKQIVKKAARIFEGKE